MAFGDQTVPLIRISVEQLILILYPSLLIPAIFLWLRELRKQRKLKTAPRGLKKLGMQGLSNVRDEFDDKYVTSEAVQNGSPRSTRFNVKALFMFPIKSCAGVELSSVDIEGAGMTWDRKFAFAELLTPQTRLDAPESAKKPQWTIRTLRQPGFEKLVHVKPEIWVPEGRPVGEGIENGALIVKFPFIPSGLMAPLDRLMISLGLLSTESSFQVPLIPSKDHKYSSEQVTVWKDSPKWLDFGKHLPDEFQSFLRPKNPLTLFRADPNSYREVYRCAPRREQLGYQPIVGFADAYPLHLLNLASVRDVGAKVKKDIPLFSARRFRSNILVTGPTAYDEDDWKRVRIGKHELYCSCHTIRCRLPNVDPDSSERHPVEPDKTLKSFRCIDDGDPQNAALGLQLVPSSFESIQIHAGDEIEVLERGKHHYLK